MFGNFPDFFVIPNSNIFQYCRKCRHFRHSLSTLSTFTVDTFDIHCRHFRHSLSTLPAPDLDWKMMSTLKKNIRSCIIFIVGMCRYSVFQSTPRELGNICFAKNVFPREFVTTFYTVYIHCRHCLHLSESNSAPDLDWKMMSTLKKKYQILYNIYSRYV